MTIMQTVLAALATAALAAGTTLASTPAATVKDPWRDRAEQAIALAETKQSTSEAAFYHAFMAGAIAEVDGWDDPRVTQHLDRVYAQRLASGGYGLPYAWDAFSDGTTNPATTTYSITVTGQVGRVMLDGYKAGVVPRAEIERLVDVTLRMPRINDGKPGVCISYSSTGHDTKAGYCVFNIVASAGKFLADARDAGVVRPGQDALLAGLTQRDAANYATGSGFWPYRDGAAGLNDWNHNAVNVDAELTLSPAIGRDALSRMMARTDPVKWVDPLGQIALLPHDCARSGDLLDDFDAMLADARQTAGLAAQMAYWSAQATTC